MKLCGKEFAKLIGFWKMIRMFSGMRLNRYMPKMHDDEYFIASLAVYPEQRSMGVASLLLKEAEKLAKEKGLKKLSLCVEIENFKACELYKKFGFKEEKAVVLPKKYKKHKLIGFIKMVKEI